MSNPREKEAQNYLEKHKILELFDHITSELIFHRPGKLTISSVKDCHVMSVRLYHDYKLKTEG